MTTSALTELFVRDLNRLVTELEQYPSADQIWLLPTGINNSAGTLALHLVGNLQHFIGAVLGDTGYVRDREAEFNDRNVPVHQLIQSINSTIEVIDTVLGKLSSESLQSKYPLEVFGEPISTIKFLIHLQGHLNYHLGQVNYHRRLLAHS